MCSEDFGRFRNPFVYFSAPPATFDQPSMKRQLHSPVFISVVLNSALLVTSCGGSSGPSSDIATTPVAQPTASTPDIATPASQPEASTPHIPATPVASTESTDHTVLTADTTTPTQTPEVQTLPAPPSGVGPRISTFVASGPIIASAGQIITGVRVSNPNGPCIEVPTSANGVTIRDSEIGPCGGEANVYLQGANALVEHNRVFGGNRGVLGDRAHGIAVLRNEVQDFAGDHPQGKAIEADYTNGGRIEGNRVRGREYRSDVVSIFESSGMRVIDNDIDVHIAEPTSAGFTMGDGTGGDPGRNNYVSGNIVRQTGGVPAGVFGSAGNTVLEGNCLTAGIQAYNYSGQFVGVTVRNNVINLGNSFVPDASVISGWDTNINSTDCALLQR